MRYPQESKSKALNLYFKDAVPVSKISKQLKINASSIYNWISEHKKENNTVKPQLAAEKVIGKAPKLQKLTMTDREQIELQMLREEVRHLRSMCAYFEKMLNL